MSKCLTCKHWKKDKEDGIIGKCVQLNEFRFQFETENMFCKYEFGENRNPARERYRPSLLEEKPKPTTPKTTQKTTPYYWIKAAERKQAEVAA